MSWSEIKKAVNSDLSTPLNTLINNRPKGYKLKFDSYEENKINGTFDKTYTSSTGGCVRFYTNRDSGGSLNIDGTNVSHTMYIPFILYKNGSNSEFCEIFFNNSIRIQLPSSSSTYTICNIAVYKYVPIT